MAQIILFTGSGDIPFVRPVGAYQIANVLRKNGYTVQVIEDFPILMMIPGTIGKLLRKYVGPDTLWLGFSTTFFVDITNPDRPKNSILQDSLVMSSSDQQKVKEFVNKLNPKTKLVLGGSKSWMLGEGFIDCYIEGYADDSVVKYTKWLQGKNPFLTYRTNVDGSMSIINDRKAASFDYVQDKFSWDDSDYIMPGEALSIEIARGCIFKCKFCSYPLNGKPKMDYIKSPDILYDQFIENYERFKTTDYIFVDDTFNDSPEKLEILYNKVFSRLPFKINFGAYLRLDLLRAHPHTIDLLKDSGIFSCFFGIESMNEKSNRIVGKGIKTERIIETLHTVREKWNHAHIVGGFILGLPYDSEETIRQWASTVIEKNFPLDSMSLEVLNIFPIKKDLDAVWINDLEAEPEKYGYKFVGQAQWINNMGLTRKRAEELNLEFNNLMNENNKLKTAWTTPFGMQNLGIKKEEAKNILQKDVITYRDLRKEHVLKYLGKLL